MQPPASRSTYLWPTMDFIDELIPRLIDQDPERVAALTNTSAGRGTSAGLLLFAVALTAMLSMA